MDLALVYAGRQLPDSMVLLGETVRPITIGHGLLLQRLESPFAPFVRTQTLREPQLGDLLAAVFILSRDPSTASRQLFSGVFRFRMMLWAWSLRVVLWWSPWRSILVPEVSDQLFEFIRGNCLGPRFSVRGQGDGDPCGSPDLGVLKISLMAEMGMPESEALATPIAKAIWDCSILWETQGRVRIWPEVIEGWKPPAPPQSKPDGSSPPASSEPAATPAAAS